MATVHRHFDSSRAVADFAVAQGVGADPRMNYYGYSTDSRVSSMDLAREGVYLLRTGDNSYVEDARKLLQKFSEGIQTPHFVWEHSLVGAFPDVPNYLAGDPENMWYKSPKPSDRTPLRIFVSLSASGGITPDQLRGRGLALAALAMALSEVRPVYITPFSINYGGNRDEERSILSWDISTSPLVLAELLAVMSDHRITRHVRLPLCYSINPRIDRGMVFASIQRDHIPNIQDGDLYIAPLKGREPLLNDPVTWLKEQIARYGQQEGDE